MELDITDLGSTLVVGAFVLYGADLISGSILGRNVFGWIRDSRLISDRGTIAIALALCFAMGIAAESISDAVLDGPGGLGGVADWWPGAKNDEQIKAEVLFGETAGEPQLSQAPLLEAHRTTLSGMYFMPDSPGTRAAAAAAKKQAIKAAKSYYHYAKNRAFQNDNYFTELTRIQTRIDFIRSLWLVSVGLTGLLAVMVLAKLFADRRWMERGWARIRRRRSGRAEVAPASALPAESAPAARTWLMAAEIDAGTESFAERGGKIALVRRTLIIGVALLACSYLNMVGFRREEREFDQRVYGYYRTLQGAATDPQLCAEMVRLIAKYERPKSKEAPCPPIVPTTAVGGAGGNGL